MPEQFNKLEIYRLVKDNRNFKGHIKKQAFLIYVAGGNAKKILLMLKSLRFFPIIIISRMHLGGATLTIT